MSGYFEKREILQSCFNALAIFGTALYTILTTL